MSRMMLAAAAAGLLLTATAANAETQGFKCDGVIAARGVSSHIDGGQDFERYKGQVPPGLAKSRAIDAWKSTVARYCPSHSDKWWRARTANVTCDNGMGHEYCTATATPARKLLSVLFD